MNLIMNNERKKQGVKKSLFKNKLFSLKQAFGMAVSKCLNDNVQTVLSELQFKLGDLTPGVC